MEEMANAPKAAEGSTLWLSIVFRIAMMSWRPWRSTPTITGLLIHCETQSPEVGNSQRLIMGPVDGTIIRMAEIRRDQMTRGVLSNTINEQQNTTTRQRGDKVCSTALIKAGRVVKPGDHNRTLMKGEAHGKQPV